MIKHPTRRERSDLGEEQLLWPELSKSQQWHSDCSLLKSASSVSGHTIVGLIQAKVIGSVIAIMIGLLELPEKVKETCLQGLHERWIAMPPS